MSYSKIKETYNNEEKDENLSKEMNELRKIGKYCDYVLESEDGGSFTVHKIVLESVSPFFKKMLNSELIGKNKDSLLLQKCSSNVLENIIELMYTGNIEITLEYTKETLETALFLCLDNVIDACTQVLVNSVNTENCFELLSYAETYHRGNDLKKSCIGKIFENLNTLKDSPEFMHVSSESMEILLSSDRKISNGFEENDLYSIVIKWVTYDSENRKQLALNFIDKIKFNEISLKFGIQEIFKDCCLFENKEMALKIHDKVSKNWEQQINQIKMRNLYTVIGSELVLYDFGINPFSNVITNTCDNCDGSAITTFGDEKLFVGGGVVSGKIVNNCNYYSMSDNSWNPLPPMGVNRSRSSAITLNNKIYVCGGENQETVEIFDINEMKWQKGPSFSREVSLSGLCLHNETIYSVDGINLQFLDTKTEKWIDLPSWLLDEDSSSMNSLISHENFIYGFSFKGVHTFDIRANKWLKSVKLYKQYEWSPFACKINNEIYVLGRKNDKSTYMLNTYDIRDFSNYNHQFIKTNKNSEIWYLFSL